MTLPLVASLVFRLHIFSVGLVPGYVRGFHSLVPVNNALWTVEEEEEPFEVKTGDTPLPASIPWCVGHVCQAVWTGHGSVCKILPLAPPL